MAKLKSRNAFPPNGWQFIQPQTGWQAPSNASFDVVVRALIDHRKANPFVTQQNNLSLDYDAVADEVDSFNAERCFRKGWKHFLADAGPAPSWLPHRMTQSAVSAVGRVKKTAAGVALVRDWLGDGLRPVEQGLADKRASRCIECNQNGNPDWLQRIEGKIAEEIKTKMEIRNELKLSTPYDDRLLSCQACDCYLKLKVWTPIKHIQNNTVDDVMKTLSSVKTNSGKPCWVTEELTTTK